MKSQVLTFAVSLFALVAPSHSAVVDLSTWSEQEWSAGAGNWVVQPGNASVLQTINGNPTVFLSPLSALGTNIQGVIRVETSGDDDFIGFVLGFDDGDFAESDADYLLIDWKQGNQSGADAGLAVSRVTGIVPTADPGFWEHTSGVTELARGATFGSTGWADFVDYTFEFTFSPNNLQVSVNGVTEININGSFSEGNLGFYNYSQSQVRYSGFTQDILPPTGVPEGGWSLGLLGMSLAGLGFFRRCLRSGNVS